MKTKKLIIGAIAFALFGCNTQWTKLSNNSYSVEEKVLTEKEKEEIRNFYEEAKQKAYQAGKNILTYINENYISEVFSEEAQEYLLKLCLDGNRVEEKNPLSVLNPFDFQKPLSEWPIVDPLSAQEKKFFDQTWNKELSEKENQENLVNKFLDKCVDFSFRIKNQDQESKYCIGEVESGQQFLFLPFKNNKISIKNKKIVILDEDGKNEIISVQPNIANCIGLSVLDNTAVKYKEQFTKYFEEIAKDPVGCWMLRVILSKMVVNNNKITLIPACPQGGDISPLMAITVFPLQDYIQRQTVNKIPLMFFHPERLDPMADIDLVKKVEKNFELISGSLPFESGLLHEIIHHIHILMNEFCFNLDYTIRERNGDISIAQKAYTNDEEYRTMFGLTCKGLDLLNESSYLASKYGYIRPGHSISNSKILFNSQYKDTDLLEFYLSSNFHEHLKKLGMIDFQSTGDPSLLPKDRIKLEFM